MCVFVNVTHRKTLGHLRDDHRKVLHGVTGDFSQLQLVSESISSDSFHTFLEYTQHLGPPLWRCLHRSKHMKMEIKAQDILSSKTLLVGLTYK